MKEKWETFRFTNDQLQSSLIKTIDEAGLVHKVREDGTILYPQEYSIEKFVGQIVETIFPDGYYRTEISDNTKAERYRRFKKFAETALVEEIRSGKTYFVQEIYEKIYRNKDVPTHISFILADEDLNPDKVTAHLGISPTFACFKGEPFTRPHSKRKKDAPLNPSRVGWWELCSIPDVESNDIEFHLEWLLEILEPVSSKLKSIRAKSANKDFVVLQIDIVKSRNGFEGISLSSSIFRRLGILSDRIDIRFWPDDYV